MSDLPSKSELLIYEAENGESLLSATHKELLSVRREGKRDVRRSIEGL